SMKPSETRWARYNPKAPYDIAFDQDKATYEKHTFDDVQSVGFYVAKSKGMKVRTHTNVLAMVESPEGSYVRGDSTKIFVSESFFAKSEVSYAQWKKVRDWGEANGYTFNYDGDMGAMDYQTWKHRHAPDEPVTGVTRTDVLVWCNALSEMEGRKPCYYQGAAKTQAYRTPRMVRAHWSRRPTLMDEPELRVLGWQPGMNIDEMGYNKGPCGTFDTYGLPVHKSLHGGGFPPRSYDTVAAVDWSTDGYRLPWCGVSSPADRSSRVR
ncbi:MAG: formylglycine-generating enzyme family protein, partial [Propionibacteriaceae bacterium]|nr:formylglycine-generating enzyme family protein [Propionibacteriaceae bacterium]